MSLSAILQRIETIADTSSNNEKVCLLRDYLNDSDFLKVVRFALAKDKMFKIKKLPGFKRQGLIRSTNEELFDFLDQLTKQTGASDSDKNRLAQLASIDKSTYEVVCRIVAKDLKCGASARLVNKARSGTVNIVPYMRCSTHKKMDNIQYPAIIQEKADGMYVSIMVNKKGQVRILTRNGKIVWGLTHLKKILRKTACMDSEFRFMVYTGELLVLKKGKVVPRKTGNGILNSCISGTVSPDDAGFVIFRCWDCLPLDKFYEGQDNSIFIHRFEKVKQFIKRINNQHFFDFVLTKQVSCVENAEKFYRFIREHGGEGAILKNTFGIWKDHTSPDQVKLKNAEDAELKVVAFKSGKKGSKYQSMLGALNCVSACGKLKVSVGSGFSDEERKKRPEYWLGKTITVEFESVIEDKKRKEKSLFLPRFVKLRLDRTTPDTLEEIINR